MGSKRQRYVQTRRIDSPYMAINNNAPKTSTQLQLSHIAGEKRASAHSRLKGSNNACTVMTEFKHLGAFSKGMPVSQAAIWQGSDVVALNLQH